MHIELWYDEASDADDPSWIVSEESAEGSDTIRWFEPQDYNAARAFATQYAAQRGLPLYEIDEGGVKTVID